MKDEIGKDLNIIIVIEPGRDFFNNWGFFNNFIIANKWNFFIINLEICKINNKEALKSKICQKDAKKMTKNSQLKKIYSN